MRVVVLGTGIGTVVIQELAHSAAIDEVVAVDAAPASVERCVSRTIHPNVSGKVVLLDQLRGAFIAVGKLGGTVSAYIPSFYGLEAAASLRIASWWIGC